METLELLRLAVPVITAVIAGIGGVSIGAWLTGRNEAARRRLEFVEKQLRDLYSPLHSIRREIRSLSELRVRVQRTASESWQELAKEERAQGREKEFTSIVDHHNEQMRRVLLPQYRRMATLLRDGFFLAESSTREHLPALIEFVELWERFLDKSFPTEVFAKLDVTEENLNPLYDDIENKFLEMRQRLAVGRA